MYAERTLLPKFGLVLKVPHWWKSRTSCRCYLSRYGRFALSRIPFVVIVLSYSIFAVSFLHIVLETSRARLRGNVVLSSQETLRRSFLKPVVATGKERLSQLHLHPKGWMYLPFSLSVGGACLSLGALSLMSIDRASLVFLPTSASSCPLRPSAVAAFSE